MPCQDGGQTGNGAMPGQNIVCRRGVRTSWRVCSPLSCHPLESLSPRHASDAAPMCMCYHWHECDSALLSRLREALTVGSWPTSCASMGAGHTHPRGPGQPDSAWNRPSAASSRRCSPAPGTRQGHGRCADNLRRQPARQGGSCWTRRAAGTDSSSERGQCRVHAAQLSPHPPSHSSTSGGCAGYVAVCALA